MFKIRLALPGNFHLQIVGRVSCFEEFVVTLGRVTYELASSMGSITEAATAAAGQVNIFGTYFLWQSLIFHRDMLMRASLSQYSMDGEAIC